MIFITKKRFEEEVRTRLEKEICEMEQKQYRADEIREIHQRIWRLETRLEKVEDKCGIHTNLHAECVAPKGW